MNALSPQARDAVEKARRAIAEREGRAAAPNCAARPHRRKDSAPAAFSGTDAVQLDDFVALMPTHSYIFKPTGQMWPAASVNTCLPKVGTMTASAWLDTHRAVQQMTWAPGEPPIIGDRLISNGGWFDRPGCRVFNSYRPPTIGRREGDPSPWLNHVRRVYPHDADHLLRWFAHRVQRPQEKINHANMLSGQQGIGKDSILTPVKEAVGPWNFEDVSPRQVLGRFNGFLKSVVLRVSEVRDLGEADRFAFYDHMKAFTAAPPEVLRVDEKNVQEYSIPNVCGVILTSNHKTDGIHLAPDDRRHYVAYSDCEPGEFTPEYWDRLHGWFASGGNEIVADYLATLDLSGFNPKAPPPKTEAFWEIVNSARPPESAELADALDRWEAPAAVTLKMLASRADDDFKDWLTNRRHSRMVPHRLEECGYTAVRNPGTKDGMWTVGGKRQVIYAKKELDKRERFTAAQRLIGDDR